MKNIKNAPDVNEVFIKSRKREQGRYFLIGLPCAVIGGVVTGASFFILAIPGLAIAAAGMLPMTSAMKYNSEFVKDYYFDNSLPLNFKPKEVVNAYVFLPKNESVKKIIITDLKKKNSAPFDIEIPIL